MMLRRALTGLSLLVLAGTAALVPGTASASAITIAADPATVQFEGAVTASLQVTYTCGVDGMNASDTLTVYAFQPLAGEGYQAMANNGDDGTPVRCDAETHTTPVALAVREGTFANGGAELLMLIGDGINPADNVYQLVDVVGVHTPIPEPVFTLTTDASPEPVRTGKKITVRGTVARDDEAIKVRATLYFARDGGDFTKVKTVKSDKRGRLSTKVRATRSGTFAYGYGGVIDDGDHVHVIRAPKR